MGSLADLQKVLRQKDERIKDLEKKLCERDEQIQELSSKLDKYKSIFLVPPQSPPGSPGPTNGPRKQRAWGISAEPQALKNLQELTNKNFKKYIKSQR